MEALRGSAPPVGGTHQVLPVTVMMLLINPGVMLGTSQSFLLARNRSEI